MPPPGELSLLTINTWKGDGLYHQRMDWLHAQLQELQPGIITCQEVFQTLAGEAVNTASRLAGLLKMRAYQAPARVKERWFAGNKCMTASGLAILSAYPVEYDSVLRLPMDERDGERMAQFAVIRVPERILVVNVHLSHLKEGSDLRQKQLQALLNHPVFRAKFRAIFLCGDFNCTENSPEMHYLLHHDAFSVRNCYHAGKGSQPGYTLVSTRHSPPTGRCIDYICSVGNPEMPHPVIRQAEVVLNQPNPEGVYASDHFGVMIRAALGA